MEYPSTSWQQILFFRASNDHEFAQALTALRLLGKAWLVILKTQLSHFQSSTKQATTLAWMRKYLVIGTLRSPHHWAIQAWLPGILGVPAVCQNEASWPTSSMRIYGGYNQGSQAYLELHPSWALLHQACSAPAYQRQLARNFSAPDAQHIICPFDRFPAINRIRNLSLIQSLPAMEIPAMESIVDEEMPLLPLMQLLPPGRHPRNYLWWAITDLHIVTIHLRAALFRVRELLLEVVSVALVNKSAYAVTRTQLEAIYYALRQWKMEAW